MLSRFSLKTQCVLKIMDFKKCILNNALYWSLGLHDYVGILQIYHIYFVLVYKEFSTRVGTIVNWQKSTGVVHTAKYYMSLLLIPKKCKVGIQVNVVLLLKTRWHVPVGMKSLEDAPRAKNTPKSLPVDSVQQLQVTMPASRGENINGMSLHSFHMHTAVWATGTIQLKVIT